MLRSIAVFVLIALGLGQAATAVTAEQQPVVNVYSARHYDTDDELYKRFTEQTGIQVRVIEGKSDELLARLKREGEFSPADVLITVDAGRLHKAVEEGVFQPIESTDLEARVPATLRHPDGLWFGLSKRARVLAVSRERVDDSVTQLNYEDLTKPDWKGRVLVRSSSNIYNQSMVASMIATDGPEAAQAWCGALVENFARRPQGGDRDQIAAVAAGEGDVAIVNHYYYARMLTGTPQEQEAASKVRIIFPNQDERGTHVNISGAGVVRNAPNRENAIRFIEFLASEEAQQVFAGGNQEYPVVEDVSITSVLSELGPFRSDSVNATDLGVYNREAVMIMDRVGWR